MEHECPICYENTVSIFTNISCKHTWCKECHHKLIEKNHTECVMCRVPIILKKKIKPQAPKANLVNIKVVQHDKAISDDERQSY